MHTKVAKIVKNHQWARERGEIIVLFYMPQVEGETEAEGEVKFLALRLKFLNLQGQGSSPQNTKRLLFSKHVRPFEDVDWQISFIWPLPSLWRLPSRMQLTQ